MNELDLIKFIFYRLAPDKLPDDRQLNLAIEDYIRDNQSKDRRLYYDNEHGWRFSPAKYVTDHTSIKYTTR